MLFSILQVYSEMSKGWRRGVRTSLFGLCSKRNALNERARLRRCLGAGGGIITLSAQARGVRFTLRKLTLPCGVSAWRGRPVCFCQ